MKPSLVLGLVGAAVAALFIALLQFGPSDPAGPGETGPGLAPGVVPATPTPGPRPNADLSGSGTSAAAARAAETGESRSVVAGEDGDPVGALDNSLTVRISTAEDVSIPEARVVLMQLEGGALMEALGPLVNPGTDSPRGTWSGITDATGTVLFRSIPPSKDYTLVVEHPGYSRLQVPNVVVLASGNSTMAVHLQAGFRLEGLVMDDATGRPIPGASLRLESIFAVITGSSGAEGMETVSDAEGRYFFENIPPGGTRNLVCEAPSYGSQTRRNLLFSGPVGEPIFQDFRLDVGRSIRGRVVAQDLSPIAGARIQADSIETAITSSGTAVTDANGIFEVRDLSKGVFMVVARAEGFSDQRLLRVEVDGPEVQIVMPRQGGASGVVVRASDGLPVTEFQASVRAVPPGTTVYGRVVKGSTFRSAEGAFSFTGLEPGTYVVQAETAGYAPTYSETFAVTLGVVTPDVRVELGSGGRIVGRLLDARTGDPVAGAKVKTLDNEYVVGLEIFEIFGGLAGRTTTDRQVRTGADGSFSLDLLTAATYQVHFEHPDYTTISMKNVYVRDGQTNDLGAIEARGGALVRGTVFDGSGVPIAGAKISITGEKIHPGTIRSDGEGNFVITRVQPGTWRLSAIRPESEQGGNPFGPIIDMKKSEVTIHLGDGQELIQNLYLGE